VATKAIAEAVGRGLGLPVTLVAAEDAVNDFGFISSFFAMDAAVSSERTRMLLGWEPIGPTPHPRISTQAPTSIDHVPHSQRGNFMRPSTPTDMRSKGTKPSPGKPGTLRVQ
jgi:hypothetical protein